MAKMFNPPHTAATLREDVLPALGLSVAEAARQLGVSRIREKCSKHVARTQRNNRVSRRPLP